MQSHRPWCSFFLQKQIHCCKANETV
jgi:hypothetical protein